LQDRVKRSRVTVGLAHDFAEGKTLGIYYRYGFATTDHYYQGSEEPTSGKQVRTSEIGMRWRSPLTRRLYYGLHGSMLFDTTRGGKIFNVYMYERFSNRLVFGGGLGYEIRPHTTIAFDIAGGSRRRTIKGPFVLPYDRVNNDRFLTLHVGGQTDLGRRLFVN